MAAVPVNLNPVSKKGCGWLFFLVLKLGVGGGCSKKTPCSSWMHYLRSINQPLAPWMTINQPLSPPSSFPLPFPTPNPQSAGIGVINLKHTYRCTPGMLLYVIIWNHMVCYVRYGWMWSITGTPCVYLERGKVARVTLVNSVLPPENLQSQSAGDEC